MDSDIPYQETVTLLGRTSRLTRDYPRHLLAKAVETLPNVDPAPEQNTVYLGNFYLLSDVLREVETLKHTHPELFL